MHLSETVLPHHGPSKQRLGRTDCLHVTVRDSVHLALTFMDGEMIWTKTLGLPRTDTSEPTRPAPRDIAVEGGEQSLSAVRFLVGVG